MHRFYLLRICVLSVAIFALAKVAVPLPTEEERALQQDIETLKSIGYMYEHGCPGWETWERLRARFRQRGSDAVPALIEVYEMCPSRAAGSHIALILAEIGDVRAVRPLVRGLADARKTVSSEDEIALARLAPASIPALIEAFVDGNPPLREKTAEILYGVKDIVTPEHVNAHVPRLLRVFDAECRDDAPSRKHPYHVQKCVAHLLVQAGPESVPGLIEHLDNGDSEIRLSSINCLAKLSPLAAVVKLTALADNDPNLNVRSHAVRALGEIGGKQALACIKRILFDPADPADPAKWATLERESAAKALAHILGQEAVPYLREALKENGAGPTVLAELIGTQAQSDLVGAFYRQTKGEGIKELTMEIRLLVRALGMIRYGESVEPYKQMLDFTDSDEVAIDQWRSAMWGLGRSGNLHALPIMRKYMYSTDRTKRHCVLGALRDLQHKSVIPPMLEMARDPDDGVAQCALIILMEMTDTRSIWPTGIDTREEIEILAEKLNNMYLSGTLKIEHDEKLLEDGASRNEG